MEKTCRKCSKQFSPTNHQIKKHDWLCAECTRASFNQWARKRRAAGFKVSGRASPEWEKEYRKTYYAKPSVRARRAELMRGYRNDPKLRMKHEARWQLNRAIESGRIKRKPCEKCGAEKSEAHHPDYYKPLEVQWLCRKHHNEIHAK